MKANLSEWLATISGSLGTDFYAVPCANEPGTCIIRRKPGKRKKDWTMTKKQANAVQNFKSVQEKAHTIYHEPTLRAQYEQEYIQWMKTQSEHNKTKMLNGKCVRFLWDYIRIRVAEQMNQ